MKPVTSGPVICCPVRLYVRATVPAACPLSFGITNELRTALEALADKADTCVAEVARDCIEAGIGAVRARLRSSRRRNGQKGGAPDLGNSRAWTRGVDWLASLHTTIRARAPAARRYSLARWGGVPK